MSLFERTNSGGHPRLHLQHLPGTGTVLPPRTAPSSPHRSRHTPGLESWATEPPTVLLYRLRHRGAPTRPIVHRVSNENHIRHPGEGRLKSSNDVSMFPNIKGLGCTAVPVGVFVYGCLWVPTAGVPVVLMGACVCVIRVPLLMSAAPPALPRYT